MYDWTIARIGSQWEFYYDGSLFASVPDDFSTPATGVVFDFLGPNPPEVLGAFHVDRVRVVPAPATPVGLAACALFWTRRRRSRSMA